MDEKVQVETKTSQVKRKKILYYTEGWGRGGIETFILNCIRALNSDNYQITIFCTHDWDDCYDEELSKHEVVRKTVFKRHKPNLLIRTLRGAYEWRKELQTSDYDAVHINTMNGMGFLYAYIAYKYGVQCRIVHSHNSMYSDGARMIKATAHELGKLLFGRYATNRLACSSEAGSYLFGSRYFELMRNSVDTKEFQFSAEKRKIARRKCEIADKSLVLGFIGRLTENKNPEFVIEIYKEVLKKESDAALIMVGSGPLSNEIERKVSELGGSGKIVRVSGTNRVSELMCAMDVICVPSRFEGLPLICIEAQANGLSVILSTSITEEAKLTNRATFLSIEDGPTSWADAVRSISASYDGRERYALDVEKANYGLKALRKRLESLYVG